MSCTDIAKFDRQDVFEIDDEMSTKNPVDVQTDLKAGIGTLKGNSKALERVGNTSVERIQESYWEGLKPWSGYIGKDNMLTIFLRPFPFLLSPIVWYGIFTCKRH